MNWHESMAEGAIAIEDRSALRHGDRASSVFVSAQEVLLRLSVD